MALPLVGCLALLRLSASKTKSTSAQLSSTPVAVDTEEAESCITMHATAGGRRKRLGVAGKTCMLLGKQRTKGYTRTYSEKKVVRFWHANVNWKSLYWEEEKKWVRLRISSKALKLCDTIGVQRAATQAGLDLYAWCKPHWEPGSRQPLALKVGHGAKAVNDRKFWPDYEPFLNKGRPMGEVTPAPYQRPKPFFEKKKGPWGGVEAPPSLKVGTTTATTE